MARTGLRVLIGTRGRRRDDGEWPGLVPDSTRWANVQAARGLPSLLLIAVGAVVGHEAAPSHSGRPRWDGVRVLNEETEEAAQARRDAVAADTGPNRDRLPARTAAPTARLRPARTAGHSKVEYRL